MVLAGGRVVYLDVGNEHAHFAAEYNGVEWHTSAQQVAHDVRRLAEIQDEGWVVNPVVNANSR